ncbi:MAG: aspartate aminotransferase family protein [Desulfurococcales archaeon]|nr:aspartate aminotransferase family protein [Desulfurococcales archaeon]
MDSRFKGVPENGLDASRVLEELEALARGDLDPHSGRLWAHVYDTGLEELAELARKAYSLYMDKTMLNFTVYPSLIKLENDVVGMVASLMNAPETAGGTFTYGGTESIILAVKAAREHYRRNGGGGVPEIVLPITAHPAFHKAADLLGMKTVVVGVNPETMKVDVDEVTEAITGRTALIAVSAPNYPYGSVDPVREVGEVAQDRGVWLHVDACIGGFVLPFFKQLGVDVPDFDFTIEGVTSISVDLHKYGYAPKGASVVVYRDKRLKMGQVFVKSSWPGYPIVNTALLSTRSAGPLAASWAVLNYLGLQGYMEQARRILNARAKILGGLENMGFRVLGKPESSIVAFTRDDVNIFQVAGLMRDKGWYVQEQPGSRHLGIEPSLHLTITPVHDRLADAFLDDLRGSVSEALRNPMPRVDELVEQFGVGMMQGQVDPGQLMEMLGVAPGKLPSDMTIINSLMHGMEPKLVEEVLKLAVNEIFTPSRQG